jgi:hypothetical protein
MNRPHQFKHRDVVRLLRAGSAGGMTKPTVEVHLPSGTKYVLGGEVGAPKPKKSTPLRAALAQGGETAMHGQGDRTKTAPADAAGTQQPGSTAHKTSSRGGLLAEGGSRHGMFREQAADPAPAGRTAKPKSAATGGEARPARPGSCGT